MQIFFYGIIVGVGGIMKKIVIYYSKTGNSKRVAEKIGNNLGKSCKNPLHFNEEMNCSCFLQKN